MKRERGIWQRLAQGIDLPTEPLPGMPIVELAGDCRVVIENHFGVTQYSREKIGVKVKFGTLCITGCQMELMRMSREQLVITGNISGIALIRRDAM